MVFMGRKNRLKREPRRAKAQYDRVDFLGGSMELEGSRITTTLSGDAEELDAVREQIARWSESAPSDINARVEQLSAAIASRPTASLLAQLAAITKLANPETYKEYETEHLGIELEYATWLSLQRPEPNKNNTWINGPELQAIADELKDLFRCVLLYHTVAPGELSGTLDLLSRKTRTHEIGIRNPGYPHHLMGLLHKLFCRFESNLLRIIGFSIDDALIIWRALCDHLNEETSRIVDEGRYLYRFAPSALRRGQLGELVNIGVPTPLGEILLTLSQREGLGALARYCVGSTWNRFQEAMLVKPQIIADRAGISKEKVANFLKVFALEFGQARIADNWPSRYEPLTQAPLLHMGEESYLIHLAHETLWAIRPNLEQKLRGAGLRQRYERHRANVTEAEALQLLSSILPGSEPFHNLYYTMSDEDGRPTQYEVDGLMVYDRTLVVVEIKSGVISSPARRGAPSLKEDLDELLGSAREQASRVTKYLKSTDEAIFIMRDNRKVFLRLGDFSRVLEIVVTLDSISAFASDLTEFLGTTSI